MSSDWIGPPWNQHPNKFTNIDVEYVCKFNLEYSFNFGLGTEGSAMNRGFCKEQKPLFQPNKVNFRRRISAEASAEDHRRSLGRSQLRFNTEDWRPFTAVCLSFDIFQLQQRHHKDRTHKEKNRERSRDHFNNEVALLRTEGDRQSGSTNGMQYITGTCKEEFL